MSDLISKQRAIEAIDRFIPADPMMSDYTQGISVGLAIATRCIEEFSQENHDSSQGLVKQKTKRQATIPSDCISRRDAIKSMANAIWHYPNELYTGLNSYEMSEALAKDGLMHLPSTEPKTPSNGSITCVKPEKMHDRTMGDLIRRQEAKDAIDMALDHIDHVPPWVYDKLLNVLNEVPSAEKAQLSEEDATSVCKCPCEYREPCDDCYYEAYRGHGCPAKEGGDYGDYIVVTAVFQDLTRAWVEGIDSAGRTVEFMSDEVKKTGRHFTEVKELLRKIRGE